LGLILHAIAKDSVNLLPELQADIVSLARTLREYARLSGKTEDEIIQHKSKQLAMFIYRGLKALAPAKGAITAERMAALKAGGGIKIRPRVMQEVASKYQAMTSVASGKTFLSIRKRRKGQMTTVSMATQIENKAGKKVGLHAFAAERELKVRESGRGFSGFATPRPGRSLQNITNFEREIESRYGFLLSEFQLQLNADDKKAVLRWFGAHGDYHAPAEAVQTSKQQAVVRKAVQEVNADTMIYIARKQREAAAKAGLN
jgi:hypothetical protein